jgi:hypothetical protein
LEISAGTAGNILRLQLCFIQVKVDAKTKNLLDDYRKKKKRGGNSNGVKREDKEEGEADEDDGEVKDDDDMEDDLDEFTLREDRVAQAGLDAIMREYAEDLSKVPVTGKSMMSHCHMPIYLFCTV